VLASRVLPGVAEQLAQISNIDGRQSDDHHWVVQIVRMLELILIGELNSSALARSFSRIELFFRARIPVLAATNMVQHLQQFSARKTLLGSSAAVDLQ